jgi:hypothetical protein
MANLIDVAILLKLKQSKLKQLKTADINGSREFYSTRPIDFFVDKLGVKRDTLDWLNLPDYANHKWDGTVNPLVSVLDYIAGNNWVGVESATATGKTFLGAGIVYWFLYCFENSLVITTAPKEDQLKLGIWREIIRNHDKIGLGELLSLKLRMISGVDNWLAVGFTSGVGSGEASATKAQGFHAEHMLIILEETPGVPDAVISAFQNTSTAPHNLILAFGNPDHSQDNLHRFCNLPNVKSVRISDYDHPNVVTKNPNFIPGATSEDDLKRKLSKYGSDTHPLFLSRARGISPAQSQDSLINIEWCRNAFERWDALTDSRGKLIVDNIKGEKGLGVDVANSEFGDKASLCYGKGVVCLKVDDFQCPDSNKLGHQVYQILKDECIKPSFVGIDGVGVGAGTVNTLREHGVGGRNINLQSGNAPVYWVGEEKFKNLRAQMWWQLREDLRLNIIALPNDEELFADIVTPKWFTQNNLIVVESKETIKKRLGRSPNKGDSLVYWNWVRNQGKYSIPIASAGTREAYSGY